MFHMQCTLTTVQLMEAGCGLMARDGPINPSEAEHGGMVNTTQYPPCPSVKCAYPALCDCASGAHLVQLLLNVVVHEALLLQDRRKH